MYLVARDVSELINDGGLFVKKLSDAKLRRQSNDRPGANLIKDSTIVIYNSRVVGL